MKKIICLILSLSLLFLSGCEDNQEAVVEEMHNKCLSYEAKIQEIDPALKIYSDVSRFSNGDIFVSYSLETEYDSTVYVTFECINAIKPVTKLEISIVGYRSHSDEYHINLLSSFICEFSQKNMELEEIKNIVYKCIDKKQGKRINTHSNIDWDDVYGITYYDSKLDLS